MGKLRSKGDLSLKDLFGGVLHDDPVVSRPFDPQIPSGKVSQHGSVGLIVEYTGDDAGAGACSTGKRLSGASFPGADDDLPGIADPDKMDIGPLREGFMGLDG